MATLCTSCLSISKAEFNWVITIQAYVWYLPSHVALGLTDKEPGRLCYVAEREKQQQQAKVIVDIQLATAQQRQERTYGSTTVRDYVEGDFVWLHQKAVKAGLSPKLSSPWSSPFRVLKCFENATYKIKPVQGERVQRLH